MLGKTNSGTGGGSLRADNAVLLVTVPTGSTVTVTRGSVSLSGTSWVNSSDASLDTHIFSVKASLFSSSAWTVTATNDDLSVSQTVVINAVGYYGVTLMYELYVYNNGDLCESATGGWEGRAISYTQSYGGWNITPTAPQVSNGSNSLSILLTASGGGVLSGSAMTVNSIDLSNFSTITWRGSVDRIQNNAERLFISATNTAPSNNYNAVKETVLSTTGNFVVVMDVSDLTGAYYIGVNLYASGSGTAIVNVYDILCEP